MKLVDINIAYDLDDLGYPYLLQINGSIILIYQAGLGIASYPLSCEITNRIERREYESEDDWDKKYRQAIEIRFSNCLLKDRVVGICPKSIERELAISKASLSKDDWNEKD